LPEKRKRKTQLAEESDAFVAGGGRGTKRETSKDNLSIFHWHDTVRGTPAPLPFKLHDKKKGEKERGREERLTGRSARREILRN